MLSFSKDSLKQVPPGEYHLKLLIIGDPHVGKTSTVHRFVDEKFSDNYIATIGVDITRKTLLLNENCKIDYVLWDIGGQKNSGPLRAQFFGGGQAALIIFSLTDRDSFDHLELWYKDVKEFIKKEIPIILIGNKMDLTDRIISSNMLRAKAQSLGCEYVETSAKTGANINDVFYYITARIFNIRP